jgi:hypothetical protein
VEYYGLDIAVEGSDIYVTGFRFPTGNGSASDIFLLKLHDDGGAASYVSSTVYANTGTDSGNGIAKVGASIFLVGELAVGAQTDGVLLEYDTELNLLRERTWGGASNDSARDVVESGGRVYIAGSMGGAAVLDAYEPDSDSDGVPDGSDNCPTVANPTQLDTDLDGVGDACDNCPNTPNPDQANSDPDPLGDACDPCIDPNSSGVCIPTLSEWGVAAMTITLLSAGAVVLSRRRRAA